MADGLGLDTTSVCDTCHSPGGTYDGVNDPVIGARSNWLDGIYDGENLKPGKEKWCAGCHDEAPSTIQGVDAPNVVGDEGFLTNYSLGYGFYRTGHGLSGEVNYPASGGTVPGAAVTCGGCHETQATHIDGEARTYSYLAVTGEANDYRNGYRLKLVDGEEPMVIPRKDTCQNSGIDAGDFRLCFSCHETAPYVQSGNLETNFRDDQSGPTNHHAYHLSIKGVCGPGYLYTSDWEPHSKDSRATCMTCHDVHGTKQLSMVRQGLEVVYYNPQVDYDCFNLAAEDCCGDSSATAHITEVAAEVGLSQ